MRANGRTRENEAREGKECKRPVRAQAPVGELGDRSGLGLSHKNHEICAFAGRDWFLDLTRTILGRGKRRQEDKKRQQSEVERAALAIQKVIQHGVWNWCPPHCQVALVIVGVLRYQDFGGLAGVFAGFPGAASPSLQSACLECK